MKDTLLPLLDGLSAAEKAAALQRFRPLKLDRGGLLFGRGTRDPSAYWLLEGGLQLTRGDVLLCLLGAPSMLGERSLFSESGRHTLTATATSPAKLLRLERAGYEGLREAGSVVADRVEEEAIVHHAKRMRDLADSMARLPDQLGSEVLAWDRKPSGPPRWSSPRLALRSNHHLHDQPTRAIDALAEHFSPLCVGRGVGLYRAGEPADLAFVHCEGVVGLMAPIGLTRRHFLDAPKPGDVHGIVGGLDGRPRPFAMVSHSQVDALAIAREDVVALLRAPNEVGRAWRMLCLRSLGPAFEALIQQVLGLEKQREQLVRSQVAGLYGDAATPAPLRSRVPQGSTEGG